MKKIAILFPLALLFSGCSMFGHNDDEMESITKSVLKANRGVEIQFKPLEKGED